MQPEDRHAIEHALEAEPERMDLYLAHASLLQAGGDPRGELIATQHAIAEAMQGEADREKRARRLRRLAARDLDHPWPSP